MSNGKEDKSKLFKSERWLYYQDVKVLKTEVKPTEEDKKKVEDFRKFIDEKVKEEVTKKKTSVFLLWFLKRIK